MLRRLRYSQRCSPVVRVDGGRLIGAMSCVGLCEHIYNTSAFLDNGVYVPLWLINDYYVHAIHGILARRVEFVGISPPIYLAT